MFHLISSPKDSAKGLVISAIEDSFPDSKERRELILKIIKYKMW